MVKEHKSIVEYKFDTQLLIDIGDKDVDDAEDEFREFILTKLVGENTKKIVLMHLSKENNNPETAISTIHEIFDEYNVKFDDITYAKQREKSGVMVLW